MHYAYVLIQLILLYLRHSAIGYISKEVKVNKYFHILNSISLNCGNTNS